MSTGGRIALWGISLGGYLAPRAAAHDHRIAALVADAGVWDFGRDVVAKIRAGGGAEANMTREEIQAYLRSDPAGFNQGVRAAMAADTGTRWLYEHGMYVFNTSSPALFWARGWTLR
jgi:pimeloyl-ACP methyl ester carboxylesterase